MTERARVRIILTAVVEYDLPDLPSNGYGDASTTGEAITIDKRMADNDPFKFLTILAENTQWQPAVGYAIIDKGYRQYGNLA